MEIRIVLHCRARWKMHAPHKLFCLITLEEFRIRMYRWKMLSGRRSTCLTAAHTPIQKLRNIYHCQIKIHDDQNGMAKTKNIFLLWIWFLSIIKMWCFTPILNARFEWPKILWIWILDILKWCCTPILNARFGWPKILKTKLIL